MLDGDCVERVADQAGDDGGRARGSEGLQVHCYRLRHSFGVPAWCLRVAEAVCTRLVVMMAL